MNYDVKWKPNWKRYATFITNGTDSFEVQCSRFSCGIDPPVGMRFELSNGYFYINGKRAWLEIREV